MGARTFSVRVTPRAGRDNVEESAGPDGEALLKVHVTAPPAEGEANAAVIQAIAKHFGVAKGRVEIVQGLAGRNKVVRVGFPD